jgi:hypothetical protein
MAVLRLSTTARNAAADAVVDLLDAGAAAGKIEIRSGSMPATPQTAASGTLLATVTLIDPAAGSAATGVATITDPVSVTGVAAGTAGWARFMDSNNAAVMDTDVTATGGGGGIELSTTTISVGVAVDLASITYTQPQG